MQKAFSALTAMLVLASVASASPRAEPIVAKIGTNATTAVSGTQVISGYVDAIGINVPAGTTSSVIVVTSPVAGPDVMLYTNAAVTADVASRTRVAQTDNAGADLSGAGTVVERYLAVGDTVTVTITQSSGETGVTFTTSIKLD
jgi:hypothetical protein